MLRFAASLLLCIALLPRILHAQTVAGTVTEAGGGPVAGALVSLRDGAGGQRAATLTGADGDFTLRAPRPGEYRLRAERAGYATVTTAPLSLAEGVSRTADLELSPAALALEAVTVTAGDRGCVRDPRTGPRTAALWEEARKSLESARLAQERQGQEYAVRRFVRELEPGAGLVRRARSDTVVEARVTPFASLPAEELARDGYVRSARDGNVFYAPDADVLLSDVFLDGHCFRLQPGGDDQPGLLGLMFEPVRGRTLPDVRGILWLETATAELRYLDYAYTGLPEDPEGRSWGGRVELGRLPTGELIVKRWSLRMPVIGRRSASSSGSLLADVAPTLVGITEVGGEVLYARTVVGEVELAAPGAALLGTVFDSTRAAPLAGAAVTLRGTAYAARTDSAGVFRLFNVPEGRYVVEFSHPRADSLRWLPAAGEVTLAPGTEAAVHLFLPARAAPRARPAVRPDTFRTVAMDPLVASVAPAVARRLEWVGFEQRQRRGWGTFLSGEKLAERPNARLTEVISGLRRIFARPVGDSGYMFLQQDGNLTCYVPVYIDGIFRPAAALNLLRREDVVGVEVYEKTDVPGEFIRPRHDSGRWCGAIVVWTRTGVPQY